MNNKKTVSLFVVIFLLPLLLAYALLKLQWLPTTTVNNGQFLQPEVTLKNWASIDPKPWSIAIMASQPCAENCLQQRQQLKNLHLALGKNSGKVDLVLLNSSSSIDPNFKHYRFSQNPLKQDKVYLIDHMGLVLLAYPIPADQQANRLIQKGLINDLKKLLNYARRS